MVTVMGLLFVGILVGVVATIIVNGLFTGPRLTDLYADDYEETLSAMSQFDLDTLKEYVKEAQANRAVQYRNAMNEMDE